MVSRILTVASVALGIISLAPSMARAQATAADNAMPTLSERLEQFRQELLGAPGEAEQRAARQRDEYQQENSPGRTRAPQRTRQRTTKTRQTPATPSAQAPTANSTPRSNVGPSTTPVPDAGQPKQTLADPAIRRPQQLETQSARKAKPSQGLIPLQTPPERDTALQQPSSDASRHSAIRSTPRTARRPAARSGVDIESLADGSQQPTVAEQAERNEPNPLGGRPTPAHEPTLARQPTIAREPTPADPVDDSRPGVLFTTRSPVLAVQASGPRTVRVGEPAQFVVKIKNAGAAANNVVVTINVPQHAEVASAHATAGTVPPAGSDAAQGPLAWKIPRLEGKSGETLNLSLVPRSSEPMDLAVRFTYAPEASEMVVEVQEPKLEMAVSGPNDVQFGETRMYKLTISNPGNGDAENVVIGLLPVGRGAEGIASHKLGTLRAGQSKTVDVELTARQAGSITIKAQAHADGGLRAEAAEQVTVRRADLQIGVEAPRLTFAGTVGTYQITVVNTGDAPATDVQIAAMLPPDAKFIKGSTGSNYDAQQGKVTWNVGTLQPNAERSLQLHCSLATAGDNRLQYVATAADEVGASTTSTTQVEALADLKIEVRDPQGPVAVGDDAEYEVVLRNRGSAAAENVEVLVFFSEGLEAATVDGGPHEIATGQVIFDPIGAIGAKETVVLRVRAKADRSGHHVFRAELICESLGTKLAAEEATFFYGDDALTASTDNAQAAPQTDSRYEPQPTPAGPQPTPAVQDDFSSDDAPPVVPQ